MGGSGGPSSYTPPPSDMKKLEDIARRELQKPLPPGRRKVFLSFRGEDLDLVNLFRGQAKNENSDLDFLDYSLRAPFNSENADYIRRGIRERIKQSSVSVILVGPNTHKSKWVDWEIRESLKLGKGVVAVRLKDDQSIKTPKALVENGIKPVGWNHQEIRAAIDSAARDR